MLRRTFLTGTAAAMAVGASGLIPALAAQAGAKDTATLALLTTAADRVLIGGGIAIARRQLLPRVRAQVLERLESYLPFVTPSSVDRIITTPELGADAGPLGAIALAIRAAERTP